jgi:ABC-type multidrug transport system ATPase subunit
VDGDAGQATPADEDARRASLRLVTGSPAARAAPIAAGETAVPALELRGVSKCLQRHLVLDRIDLSLPERTGVLLTGRNGAGKTTLLRVVSGLIAPDSGSVLVQGLSPERSRREISRRICMLGAGNSGLYARLSVRRHLDLAGRLALLGRAERIAAVERAIDAFDLCQVTSRRADRLSTGQRQRVRLAMAFLHGPQLALLDEPSTSLDDHGLGLLRAALSRLLARGGAAIWCEPSGGHAELVYDRRLVIEDGVVHAA